MIFPLVPLLGPTNGQSANFSWRKQGTFEVERKMAEIGEKPARREHGAEWILLDYSDLVVHIQSSELRRYYMLDKLWNDCPMIELDAVKAAALHGR